jgi:hypothetical protein
MTTELLNNINFKILLKAHNNDFGKAKDAWDKICSMGKFGNVPHTYEGGLDMQGMRTMLDEQKQGQQTAVTLNAGYAVGYGGQIERANTLAPSWDTHELADRIKRIEDIASGDNPY